MEQLSHPVIGFRSWLPALQPRRLLDSGALQSRYQRGYIWGRGVNIAQCGGTINGIWTPSSTHRNNDNLYGEIVDIPSTRCHCGLQAHHDYRDNLRYFAGSRGTLDAPRMIYGIVKGWGRVEVHPDGWRAQYAEIVAIIASPNAEYAQKAAMYYGVPYLPSLENIDIVASEYGKKVPVEKRPGYTPTPVIDTLQNHGAAIASGLMIAGAITANLLLRKAIRVRL